MNSLEEAQSRLDAAMMRLEQAVGQRKEDLDQLRAADAGRGDLDQAHVSLQREHEALKSLADQTAARLETALGRLGSVLGENAS